MKPNNHQHNHHWMFNASSQPSFVSGKDSKSNILKMEDDNKASPSPTDTTTFHYFVLEVFIGPGGCRNHQAICGTLEQVLHCLLHLMNNDTFFLSMQLSYGQDVLITEYELKPVVRGMAPKTAETTAASSSAVVPPSVMSVKRIKTTNMLDMMEFRFFNLVGWDEEHAMSKEEKKCVKDEELLVRKERKGSGGSLRMSAPVQDVTRTEMRRQRREAGHFDFVLTPKGYEFDHLVDDDAPGFFFGRSMGVYTGNWQPCADADSFVVHEVDTAEVAGIIEFNRRTTVVADEEEPKATTDSPASLPAATVKPAMCIPPRKTPSSGRGNVYLRCHIDQFLWDVFGTETAWWHYEGYLNPLPFDASKHVPPFEKVKSIVTPQHDNTGGDVKSNSSTRVVLEAIETIKRLVGRPMEDGTRQFAYPEVGTTVPYRCHYRHDDDACVQFGFIESCESWPDEPMAIVDFLCAKQAKE